MRNAANATDGRGEARELRGFRKQWNHRVAGRGIKGVKKVGDPRGILRGREPPNLLRAELHRADLGNGPAARSGVDIPPRF